MSCIFDHNSALQSVELCKCFLALCIQVLMEQSRVYKSFVELFALIYFAKHELATESVIFAERFEEFFLMEGFQQLWVVRVDAPVLCKPFQQSFGHVLKMTANIKVVECNSVGTLEVKMIKHEVLRQQLQLDSLNSIIEQERSV